MQYGREPRLEGQRPLFQREALLVDVGTLDRWKLEVPPPEK